MFRPIHLCAALSFVAGASAVAGVTVNVTGATSSVVVTGGDVTITFPTQITSVVNVHIFDDNTVATQQNPNGQPNLGIGRLVIVGSAAQAGRLNLLIADGDQSFPPDGDIDAVTNLRAGLTSLGGTLVPGSGSSGGCSHDYDAHPWATTNTLPTDDRPQFPASGWNNANLRGIIIENPSLRRQTVLAAVVSRDICPGYDAENPSRGRIEVGQVLRLSALGQQQTESVLYGNINADVVAVARDQYLTYGDINDPPVPLLPGQNVAATTRGYP